MYSGIRHNSPSKLLPRQIFYIFLSKKGNEEKENDHPEASSSSLNRVASSSVNRLPASATQKEKENKGRK